MKFEDNVLDSLQKDLDIIRDNKDLVCALYVILYF